MNEERIGNYPVHPVASMFPLLEGSAYEELKQSIQKDGLIESIILDAVPLNGGRIIDGRNRMRACIDLGIVPRCVVNTTGLSAEDFILARNLFRRHLTDEQRTMIAADVMLWKETEAARQRQQSAGRNHGRGREKVGAASTQAIRAPKVSEKIAAAAKTTDHAARQAITVLKHAPELVEPVTQGRLPLASAAKVAEERKARPAMPPSPPLSAESPKPPTKRYLREKEELLRKIRVAFYEHKQHRDDLAAAITKEVAGFTNPAMRGDVKQQESTHVN